MASTPRNIDSRYYYHIYNRGVDKRAVFTSRVDYQRFLSTMEYYLYDQSISYTHYSELSAESQVSYNLRSPKGLEHRKVAIVAYCLMPNHYHFVVREICMNGISTFMSNIANSYTHYFNKLYARSGRLFEGPYKHKEIKTDETLLELTRYVHLNPVKSNKTSKIFHPEYYKYSSYNFWIDRSTRSPKGLELLFISDIERLLHGIGGGTSYHAFVTCRSPKG